MRVAWPTVQRGMVIGKQKGESTEIEEFMMMKSTTLRGVVRPCCGEPSRPH